MNALVASAPHASTAAGDTRAGQFLTFALADDTLALGIDRIREIIEYPRPTPVPHMPAYIRGVINLRGAVVPVIDLGARFGGPLSQPTRRSCVVITELTQDDHPQVIGLMVDAVHEVVDLAADDLSPAPAFGTRVRSDFIAGMARRGERFIVVLDAGRLLSVEEMERIDCQPATEIYA